MPMARFRWITFCRALDVLEKCCTNAEFNRLFEEHGLGDELDAAGGYGLTTPRVRNLLTSIIRRNPDRRDTENGLVYDVLVREAAKRCPDQKRNAFTDAHRNELSMFTSFRDSLAVDGWVIEKGVLIPTAPVALQDQRSRLRQSLAEPYFAEPLSRLDQYEAALDGGNWETANGAGRGFLAALFVAICQKAEGATVPREETDARTTLQKLGFFASGRQDDKKSPEAEFVWKMSGMMGTEGVHAGASTQETASFRYALSLLTADYFVQRLKVGHL